MNLRPYQQALISSVYGQWQFHRSVCAQLPTGGGKTVIFSAIGADAVAQGDRVLVLAHREELINQAAAKLQAIIGIAPGIIKARIEPHYDRLIQVASVQTLANRLGSIAPPQLIITDEAHHATAATYQAIYAAFPNARHLGLTATPIRTDGQGLDDIFDALVAGPSTGQLIEQGHLSQYKLFADANPMSLKGVRNHGGDYSASQLEKANPILELSGNLVKSYQRHAAGKRCITFAPTVNYSKAIAARYMAAGIPAMHLDGTTDPDTRRAALEMFRRGEVLVLSNVGLFAEGTDVPALDAVQIARPTKSLALWLQMIGRALRVAEHKPHAILLDHTQNWLTHGLPDDDFQWGLAGVQRQRAIQYERDLHTGEVHSTPENREVIENAVELLQINGLERDRHWRDQLDQLINIQRQRGYKPGWIQYQLQDMQAPYELWRCYGEYMGYKPGWAWYQYQKTFLCRVTAKM
jgi:superfamily II DNA or RNA helicase